MFFYLLEIHIFQNELKNIQDAEDEMMLALDADEQVPYMVGEVFIMKSQVCYLY